jgi:hypothetical protein
MVFVWHSICQLPTRIQYKPKLVQVKLINALITQKPLLAAFPFIIARRLAPDTIAKNRDHKD